VLYVTEYFSLEKSRESRSLRYSRDAVDEARTNFWNTEKWERPPLEAFNRGLVKTVTEGTSVRMCMYLCVCKIVVCKMQSRIVP
jgi:hypothetical protein